MRRSRWLVRGLGFALGIGVLAGIALWGGRRALIAPLRPAPFWLLLYFVALGLAVAATSRRWQLLINALADKPLCSFRACFLHQTVGRFLGQFLSQTGSDLLYRPLALRGGYAVPLDRAFQSALWDKSFDLIFALWLLVPAILLLQREGPAFAGGTIWVGAVVGLALAGAWGTALLVHRVPGAAQRLLQAGGLARFGLQPPQGLQAAPLWVVLAALGLTTVKYGLLVLRALLLTRALGLTVPPEALIVGVPISQLSLVVALTPGALGVLEGSWWAVLALFGVSSEAIAAFVLGQRLYQVAFLGGLALTALVASGLWRGRRRVER